MVVINGNSLGLSDVIESYGPDGKYMVAAEVLHERTGIIEDIPMVEGNRVDGHQIRKRTSLPETQRRDYNSGVQPTASSAVSMVETTANFTQWCEIDRDLARLGGDIGAVRTDELEASMESIGQDFADTLIAGNEATNPRDFTGILPRYSDPSDPVIGKQLVSGGAGAGIATCASMVLVGWALGKVYGFFPNGSVGGIEREDYDLQPVDRADGKMSAYVEEIYLNAGLAVADDRYISRVHSIDVSALSADLSSGADLIDLSIEATHRLHSLENCMPVWYMPKQIHSWLHRQANKQRDGGIEIENIAGTPVVFLQGIPCRALDAMTLTETSLNT